MAERSVLQIQLRPLNEAALAAVRDHPAVATVTSRFGPDDVATLQVVLREGEPPVSALVDRLSAAGASLVSVQVLRPSLEDAFVALTGTSVSDTGEAVTADAR